MHKESLKQGQMSESAYVEEAAGWSKALSHMRSRGPGDLENAMRSIEREYGVDYWVQWRLRYRMSAIKDIGVSTYMRLRAAYQAECARQVRKLEHEICITEKIAGADCAAVRAAKALVGENGNTP